MYKLLKDKLDQSTLVVEGEITFHIAPDGEKYDVDDIHLDDEEYLKGLVSQGQATLVQGDDPDLVYVGDSPEFETLLNDFEQEIEGKEFELDSYDLLASSFTPEVLEETGYSIVDEECGQGYVDSFLKYSDELSLALNTNFPVDLNTDNEIIDAALLDLFNNGLLTPVNSLKI